ncbi:mitochondrial protein Pet127-domain-containing protein [Globomyces pollinis-pini]|nr:mitochondrial protein Pet127-domain-containing protein [Globomyces pollinis-pini]
MSWKTRLLKSIPPTKEGLESLKIQSNRTRTTSKTSFKKETKNELENWKFKLTANQINNQIIQQPNFIYPPRLSHQLDSILFEKKPQFVIDPSSQKSNFTDFVNQIPNVQDFDFTKIPPYKVASTDSKLLEYTKSSQSKYYSSTSSIVNILSQLDILITNRKSMSKQSFIPTIQESLNFRISRYSISGSLNTLKYQDGVYAIDKAPDDDQRYNVLQDLGHVIELLLTMPTSTFRKTFVKNDVTYDKDMISNQRESFNYRKIGDFLLRSQLDAYHPDIGIFDLKSRASLPIRMDVENYKESIHYDIYQHSGLVESFEREYHGLLTNSFLKFNLQARIGDMHGMFLGYHNTEKFFGFQYIPLSEMDNALYTNTITAETTFSLSIGLLQHILDLAVDALPKQDLQLFIEPVYNNYTNVYVTSLDNESLEPLQFFVKVKSKVNDRIMDKPMINGKDDVWELYYDIERKRFDRDRYTRYLKSYKDL